MSSILNNDNKAVQTLDLPEMVDAIALHLKSKSAIAAACCVCRAWRVAWTPVLWRVLRLDRKVDAVPASLYLQGSRIKELTLDHPTDDYLTLVLPHCRDLQGLSLCCTKATLSVLSPFLVDLGIRGLRRLEIDTLAIHAAALVPVLADHCHSLEILCLQFPFREDRSKLRLQDMLRLLEACPHLREMELSSVEIRDDPDPNDPNQEQKLSTIQTRLKILVLDSVCLTDTVFLALLERCPMLTTISVGYSPALTSAAIYPIPELCPMVENLTTDSPLQLQHLSLGLGAFDDRMITQVALSQNSTLRTLDLRDCRNVSDAGIEAVLRHCSHLESLLLFGTSVTTAIMTGPQERWACFNTLRDLDVRQVGITDIGFRHPRAITNATSPGNSDAFAAIRRRVQMLPQLRRLAINFSGSIEELARGFSLESGSQVANGSTAQVIGESGPHLVTLNVRGMEGQAIQGDDMDAFLKNYSFLKRLVVDQGFFCGGMIRRLHTEGILYVAGGSCLWH
ncbi:hypothetical protein BGZ98_003385 [Dissophora globulifera]|nr:hypothetical protein BGZ98_003385 [Dissophora globulifera]